MNTCPKCDGDGWVVICIDDICRGRGDCMHGDGNRVCPVCEGAGEVDGDYEGEYEIVGDEQV